AAYGCYIWPSALVMSDYVWYHRDAFADCTVLERPGTSLPSLVLAKTNPSQRLILSDIPSILPVVRGCLRLNDLDESANALWIRELVWGETSTVSRLISDVEHQWTTSIDYILGSDTFYDPADFEKLLVTVSYIIHRHNPKCKFITAYQERSAKRSIQYLLDKWGLQCAIIPRESFDFDEFRFTSDDDMMGDEQDHAVPLVKMNAGSLSSVFMLVISSK
ncbi:hypothetical protein BJV82DRAFT_511658, partial [Fennellomyces sp. T-0311]